MNTTTKAAELPERSGSKSGWLLMFRLAGVFNIAVAIPLWIAPAALSRLLGLEPVPVDTLYTDLLSVAGLVGVVGLGSYCAAKGAVRLLTKSAALESARLGYGVRVNSIHPAIIKTDMGAAVVRSMTELGLAPDVEAADALIRQMHPMGYGRPEDVAEAVRYLASASGRWVNGAELVLDGGLTAG